MAFKNVLVEIRDGIATLTINRPTVLNALNQETMQELDEATDQLAADESVAGVIVTGAGEKAFVAGADISELELLDATDAHRVALEGQRIFSKFEQMSKPVVAAVRGFALGGGCELALACHMRIAAEEARFGQPEVKLGVIPGYGGTQRLPRLVGKGRALELIMTGKIIDAREAFRIGLVNRVVPGEALLQTCRDLLKTIAANGPRAVELSIMAVNLGLAASLEDGLKLEAQAFGLSCATEDAKEGAGAFLAKREAKFKGK